MKRKLCAAIFLALASPALAAAPGGRPVAVTPDTMLSSMPVQLSPQQREALQLANKGAGATAPYIATGGKLVYVHGASTPSVIAAPFQVCDVELEPGEKINEIVVGDSSRWMVESGLAGDSTPHLFIKPVDAGLETSAIITTDRRTYHLRLISQKTGHMPYIGFVYSETIRRQQQQKSQQDAKEKEWRSTTDAVGKPVDLAKLNFRYDLSGDKPNWRPERVYDDGLKTYIQLPSDVRAGEMPVVHVRKGGESVMVNYRVDPSTQAMTVDGIFKEISLIAGAGDQQESVEIRRAN